MDEVGLEFFFFFFRLFRSCCRSSGLCDKTLEDLPGPPLQVVFLLRVCGRSSAWVIPAVLRRALGALLRRAAVRLLLYGEARVRGGAQGADAALLRAQRARKRRGQRALVVQVREVVAVVPAERQGHLHRAQSRHGGGKGEAVLLGQRAPLPLLLLVHQAREHVDPLLLSPFGAEVAQHYTTEEDSVERHDNQYVQVRVPVALVRLGVRGALRQHQDAVGGCRGVLQVLHVFSAANVDDLESALKKIKRSTSMNTSVNFTHTLRMRIGFKWAEKSSKCFTFAKSIHNFLYFKTAMQR